MGDAASPPATGYHIIRPVFDGRIIKSIKYPSSTPSSYREEFWSFHFLFLLSNMWSPGRGKFWAKGHHTNKLGRGALGNAAPGLPVSESKIFEVWSALFLCSVLWPPGRGQFWPHGFIWTYEVHKEMLHTKYQSSTPSNVREEEFWSLLSLFICSNLWPCWGASFDPRGIIWTNLLKVHKEKLYTKYQSSKPSSFREVEFCIVFFFSFLIPKFQTVTSRAEQVLTRGWHHMNKLGRSPQGDALYQLSKL